MAHDKARVRGFRLGLAVLATMLFTVLAVGTVLGSGGSSAQGRDSEGVEVSLKALSKAAPEGACGDLAWRVVSSPNIASADSYLESVAVIASNDVWAVGHTAAGTLTMHWDGANWRIVSSPNQPNSEGNMLFGVTAATSGKVWAVGRYKTIEGMEQTLIIQWDGSAWNIQPSPNVAGVNNILKAVAIIGSEVWAVGYSYENSITARTLTMRYTGSTWNIVASPNPVDSSSILNGITAIPGTNELWAVGASVSTISDEPSQTLIMHWEGVTWSLVPSPSPGSVTNALRDVSATSSLDAWAVGIAKNGGPDQALALRWTGITWTAMPTASDVVNGAFNAVVALASDNVWAVGRYNGNPREMTLTEFWDGSAWSQVVSPSPGTGGNVLSDVAVARREDLWAVGHIGQSLGPDETLILRYSNLPCTPTPAPSPTMGTNASSTPVVGNPSATATRTRTPISTAGSPTFTSIPPATFSTRTTPTATRPVGTATPLACIFAFSDVPPSNTFYVSVQCLACNGILGGYSDGTFRPNNLVTRGQIAKIVSNAAGLSDPAGAQQYQDVPPTNTFYEWINRLGRLGIINGYPCGGASEPCVAPNNLPYFRPVANATRGQLAKVVSEARGYEDAPAEQIFTDVPASYTFHVWIQRLASRGIMGGYPCGGPGEPCDAQNKPYFRPQNNVTRGQTSKIVGNAYFPDCRVVIPTNTPTPRVTPTPTSPPPTSTSPPTPTVARPTATRTPIPCGVTTNYTIATQQSGATIVPGAEDIGSHCDDCIQDITLPFPFKLYGRSFTTVGASSNGNLQFVSRLVQDTYNGDCLPRSYFNYIITAHWDDLRTDRPNKGIYTSMSGTAPNRVFNIEWRTTYVNDTGNANFEVRLYENSANGKFEIIYGQVTEGGSSATIGVQQGTGTGNNLTKQFSCNTPNVVSSGKKLTFTQDACGR